MKPDGVGSLKVGNDCGLPYVCANIFGFGMRNICFLICFLCLGSQAHAQSKLAKQRIGKDIEVKVPVAFTQFTPSEVVGRYLSNSTPLAVYGDEQRTVDFSISSNDTRWKAADAVILKDFYKSTILSQYTKVTFEQEGLKEINGQQFIVFEFQSALTDDKPNIIGQVPVIRKYTYLLYALKDGKQYVFNFNSPAQDRERWKSTAAKMMQSIKLL